MKNAIALLAVAGLASVAAAQTTVNISGVNTTDGSRGLNNAEVGDVIRATISIDHTDFSAAGAIFDILARGLGTADFNLAEDGTNAFSPWSIGRNPIYFSAFSDRPLGSTNPGNLFYSAVDASGTPYAGTADTVITTAGVTTTNSLFMSLAATPPGAGGFSSVFPIDSGEASFVFEFTYQGGTAEIELNVAQVATYSTSTSIGGNVSQNPDGVQLLTVVPAPASVALLGLGGLVATRRRR